MSRIVWILTLIGLGLTPLWGCQPHAASAQAQLEARVAKLERDLRALEAARDHAMARADAAERQALEQTRRTQTAERQRDELQAQLKVNRGELEQLGQQFTSFQSRLRDLASEMETAQRAFGSARGLQLQLQPVSTSVPAATQPASLQKRPSAVPDQIPPAR
jgi:chromosome segregation ATPase